MPRLTRKALADATPPSRSSPRASTKASTAASSSPAKTRGRGGKAEVEPESPEVVTKARGRSASRGKGAAAAATPPPPAAAARQSRSRGRSAAAEEKKTPTPTRRGRGKAKKEESEEEEEVVEKVEEKDDEEEEEEEVTPKRGRGRGKGKSPAASKKATPPSGGSRSSRQSAEAAVEKTDEPKKTTPRGRGGSRSASASKPQSRSRRGAGEAEAEEEKEEEKREGEEERKGEDAAAERMDESGEAKKEKKKSEAAEKKAEPEAEGKAEVTEGKAEVTEGKAEVTEKAKTEKVDSPAKEKPAPIEEPAPASSVEAMEEETTPTAAPQPAADTKNGEVDDVRPSPKAGMKRKLETEGGEAGEQVDAKRARINGTETEKNSAGAAADVEMKDSKKAAAKEDPSDGNILKDFVVVNKDEVPAPDSSEVAAAVPREVEGAKVAAAEPMETEGKAEQSGSTSSTIPVTVVPLTEAEMAKAYASDIQAGERGETDDVSSTIVEVGSVSGSDGTGGLSRGLDISELQSASNSIDGDYAGDTSINDSLMAPEAPVLPAQQPQAGSESSADAPKPASNPAPTPTAVAASSSANSQSSTVPAANPAPNPAVPEQTSSGSRPPASSIPVSMETATASVQNSQPTGRQLAKGASSVSESLGTPDPAFLAAHSSPGILNRAYVANPAVPADSAAVGNSFSVVSYNILAECARTKCRAEYSYTPEEFLGQDYRHRLLMKELQYLNGDVVCLQEVNPAYFNNTLLPAMKSQGYDGLMKRRTKEGFDEGEATFYKTSCFDLVSSKGVSLTEVAHKEVETGGLSPEVGAAIRKYLDRADVVLLTQLRSKASGKVVTIGNIHVVWDFMRSPDVQCIQVACAIKEVVGMAGSDGAHIICGDFNSEWSSPVYQLVLDGYLSDSSIQNLQAVQRLELNDGAKSLVNHLWRAFQHTSSNLKSTYSTVTKSEPEITTFTSNMKNTVDYVFYSAGSLVPVGVLKTIDWAVIDATGGLPSKDFPSDHLSLKAIMAFNK